MICVVHPVGVQDRSGACVLLEKAKDRLLEIIFADEMFNHKRTVFRLLIFITREGF
jgi:hypothetical protein